jgi:hypothetical protein
MVKFLPKFVPDSFVVSSRFKALEQRSRIELNPVSSFEVIPALVA